MSFATAKRVAERHGTNDLVLLFADTLIEDEDLYRFLNDVSAHLSVPITRIAEGRTPWQVFEDVKFLGNSRVDPCSRILKREFLHKWLEANCDPASTVVYLGLAWDEGHRWRTIQDRWTGWQVEAPMQDPPYVSAQQVVLDAGIALPRLYGLGFPHNNCGGFCIKAGQAQFALLLATMPGRYRYHEQQERELRAKLGKDVAILSDRAGTEGHKVPLTMETFRLRVEGGRERIDPTDWGDCSCAVPMALEEDN